MKCCEKCGGHTLKHVHGDVRCRCKGTPRGGVHPLIARYMGAQGINPNDAIQVEKLLQDVFLHGLEVGMWAGSAANMPRIHKEFLSGTLPRTMRGLTMREWKELKRS